jgi:phytoene desaturase
MSPFRCPSLFTILSFLEYEHGVYHPTGGCGMVSTALARLVVELGGEIRLKTPVDRIEYTNGRPTGVTAGGHRHGADAVVLNGDFVQAAQQLIPEAQRPRWRDAKLARARLSCSAFMLYLGVEGAADEIPHHTILLARDYQRNLREIEQGILPREPSLYVQHAGASDPGMAPPGHASLYVLVPVPNQRSGIDWREVASGYRDLVLQRLEMVGLRDLERRIRYERVVTPMEWRDEFAIAEGATFSLAHDLGQMLYWRPHNRFGQGIYLVGGGTHPGSGLPTIFESARISTRLLLRDFGLDPVVAVPPRDLGFEPRAREFAT